MANDPWAGFEEVQPASPPFGNRPVITQPAPQPSPQTPLQVENDNLTNQKLQKDLSTPSEAAVKLTGRAEGLNLLEQQIGGLEAMYRQSFKGKGVGSVVEYLPGKAPLIGRPENAQFDNAGRALMGAIAQAQGLTAQQQNTPVEMEIRFGPFIPKASDPDELIESKIAQLRQLLAAQKNEIGAQQQMMGGAPQAPQAPQAQDRPAGPQVLEDRGVTMEAATDYKRSDDPRLTGLKGEYLSRLQSGQSATQLMGWMKQAGVNLTPSLMKSVAAQAKFRKSHPDVPVQQYNIDELDDVFTPTSGYQKKMTEASQTAFGAGAMAAGNAVTGNNLDSIVGMTGGNAEQARIALNDASNQHPVASLAGGLTGGVAAALGGEAALGAAGAPAGFLRSLAADTGYGAVAGAGAADDGNRLGGAAMGAVAGAGGSIGGQALAKGIGHAISPTGGKLGQMYESGVRPTPGQRFAETGMAGRALNATEEGLSSIPIVGSAIRGARQEARDQFQIGAFNESLKEVGERLPKGMAPGTAPHQYAEKVFNRVYDKARSGLKIVADNQLVEDISTLGKEVATLAEPSYKRFATVLENVVMRRANGAELSGNAYKNAQSQLGKIIRGIRKSQSGDGELADALEGLQGTLDSAARRHSDPEAVKLLDAADRGYAKLVRIQQAAKARGGDSGTFTPTQFDRSVQGNAKGNRSQEYLKGEALMQDYAEQGKTLVDRIPNSGSADRIMTAGGIAGGAAIMEPGTLSVLGALGALYAPGIRKGVTGAMKPSGPKAKKVGDAIKNRARIAGASGTALGTFDDQ